MFLFSSCHLFLPLGILSGSPWDLGCSPPSHRLLMIFSLPLCTSRFGVNYSSEPCKPLPLLVVLFCSTVLMPELPGLGTGFHRLEGGHVAP